MDEIQLKWTISLKNGQKMVFFDPYSVSKEIRNQNEGEVLVIQKNAEWFVFKLTDLQIITLEPIKTFGCNGFES